MNSIIGIVLAGGLSSRMGTDKARLASRNLRLIDVAVRKLVPLCDAGVWTGGRDYGYPWISDFEGIHGPMAAIVKLNEFLDERIFAFFIIPVDMPFLEQSDFRLLFDCLSRDLAQEALCFEQSHFPLLLRNTRRLALVIEEWKKSRTGDSVHSFLAHLKLTRIKANASSDEAFVNLNYPEEYRRYAAQLEFSQNPQGKGVHK
jgi:molybdopterin-guanine dinucleotide biosynthesis protein A